MAHRKGEEGRDERTDGRTDGWGNRKKEDKERKTLVAMPESNDETNMGTTTRRIAGRFDLHQQKQQQPELRN